MNKRIGKIRNLLIFTLLCLTPIYPSLSAGKVGNQNFQSQSEVSSTKKYGAAYRWYETGNKLYRQRRYLESVAAYEKAIELNPEFDLAINGKAWAFRNLDDLPKSLAAFEEAIKINPYSSEHWNGKGNILYYMSRYRKSLKAYNRALKINPDSANSYSGKAWSLARLEKYEKAIKVFDQAIDVNDRSANYWNGKGWALYKLGRFQEAQKTLNVARVLDPRNTYTTRYLKLVEKKL